MSKAMQLKAIVKNLARKNHIPAQAVLQNYMLERLLERISLSKYQELLVLKGGLLIASIVGISSRTTMDMDATLRGYPLTEDAIFKAMTEICAIPLEDDVTLQLDHIMPIREDDEYGGYRVSLLARYESITTPLKIDITTGDKMTPDAVRHTFRSDFDDRVIEVWAYNIETILAEKVETILRRSVLNTRPRDFYDVFILVETCQSGIDLDMFHVALNATCEKRASLAVLQNKDAILQNIQSDKDMRTRWEKYRQDYFYARDINFELVMHTLMALLS